MKITSWLLVSHTLIAAFLLGAWVPYMLVKPDKKGRVHFNEVSASTRFVITLESSPGLF